MLAQPQRNFKQEISTGTHDGDTTGGIPRFLPDLNQQPGAAPTSAANCDAVGKSNAQGPQTAACRVSSCSAHMQECTPAATTTEQEDAGRPQRQAQAGDQGLTQSLAAHSRQGSEDGAELLLIDISNDEQQASDEGDIFSTWPAPSHSHAQRRQLGSAQEQAAVNQAGHSHMAVLQHAREASGGTGVWQQTCMCAHGMGHAKLVTVV